MLVILVLLFCIAKVASLPDPPNEDSQEENQFNSRLGERIVVNKDTLEIIGGEYRIGMYRLSNGTFVGKDYVIKKLNK